MTGEEVVTGEEVGSVGGCDVTVCYYTQQDHIDHQQHSLTHTETVLVHVTSPSPRLTRLDNPGAPPGSKTLEWKGDEKHVSCTDFAYSGVQSQGPHDSFLMF